MNKIKENIVAIALLSAFVVLTLTYWFLYQNLKKAEAKVDSLKVSISEASARNRELDLIKINLKNTLENFQMLDALFVKHEEVADFLQEIENLAKLSGLSLKIVGVSNKEISKGNSSNKELLVITASAEGGFNGTLKFLRLLELLPRKIGFDRVTLKVGEINGEKKGVSAWDLQMSFYLIKEKEI